MSAEPETFILNFQHKTTGYGGVEYVTDFPLRFTFVPWKVETFAKTMCRVLTRYFNWDKATLK